MDSEKTKKRGMVLGKFMPPHLGHLYLVEFAQAFCDELCIVVGSLQNEPIAGQLRYQWMQQLMPQAHVVHLTDENPQYPEEHHDFWNIWQASLKRVLPFDVDYVFASEEYGQRLAEVLGARFVPVDIGRTQVPISGTQIRQAPFENWDYLPRCVRPYFLKKVCIFGPESTGKSTLGQKLAEHYQTVCVPEYARTWLERKEGDVELGDMRTIVQGQLAAQKALEFEANRIVFSDTDPLLSTIWSEKLFGQVPDWMNEVAQRTTFNLYLVTDVDVPWVADKVRYLPKNRSDFFARCIEKLEQTSRPYCVLRGGWEDRFAQAVEAVNSLVAQRG